MSSKSDEKTEEVAKELNVQSQHPLKKPTELTWNFILNDEPLDGDHWNEDDYSQSDNLSEWSSSGSSNESNNQYQ